MMLSEQFSTSILVHRVRLSMFAVGFFLCPIKDKIGAHVAKFRVDLSWNDRQRQCAKCVYSNCQIFFLLTCVHIAERCEMKDNIWSMIEQGFVDFFEIRDVQIIDVSNIAVKGHEKKIIQSLDQFTR